jgi:selenocysteine lyase/cysteine desulfurase
MMSRAKALEQHAAFRTQGGGEGRSDFGEAQLSDLKQRFASLIGARPTEIAFVQNTSDGENIVVMGMDLAKRGGNVVLDELHFETSLYLQVARGEGTGAARRQAPQLGD